VWEGGTFDQSAALLLFLLFLRAANGQRLATSIIGDKKIRESTNQLKKKNPTPSLRLLFDNCMPKSNINYSTVFNPKPTPGTWGTIVVIQGWFM
jgi:hypothetical protein